MNVENVGLLSTACFLPPKSQSLEQVCEQEGIKCTDDLVAKIGVDNVPVFEGDDQTLFAVEAANLAIEKAGISALDIDVVLDFSIMPQKYVEPAWSMSNEIQAEIGAKNAFTVGYSGAGATNTLVALESAASLIQGDDQVKTVLMVAGDCAIPGNRLLGGDNPISVLGDASSAAIVQAGVESDQHIATKLISRADFHDISYIEGGGIKHPTRLDLYKLTVDQQRLQSVDLMEHPKQLVEKLLAANSLSMSDIKHCLFPNFSASDQQHYQQAFGISSDVCTANIKQHGHIQATDLLLNYASLKENGAQSGDYALLFSHGLGFMSGATLMKL